MRNEFIYDLMRSEEIREYYRKNVELDTEEQECVIINCYKSLKEKLELLKKLYNNVPEEDKNNVKEMITLYELVNTIYYNPYEFFGNDCRVIYVVHYLEAECNLLFPNMDLYDFLHEYTTCNVYFDSLEEAYNYMNIDIETIDSFEIELIIIPKNDKSYYPISFYGNNINGNLEPITFTFDDELFDKFNIPNSVDTYKHRWELSYKGLPFATGTKVKFQTPIMRNPFYGFIRCTKDENDCWYCFVFENEIEVHDTDHPYDFLNMSFINLCHTSDYAIFDWLERA